MSGTAACRQWNVPVRLTARMRSQLSIVMSVKDSNASRPALVTMIPMGPSSARTLSRAASTAPRSVTSASARDRAGSRSRAGPRRPAARLRPAGRAGRPRSPRAARCRAIASPIPDAAPVTTATRPIVAGCLQLPCAAIMPSRRALPCNNALALPRITFPAAASGRRARPRPPRRHSSSRPESARSSAGIERGHWVTMRPLGAR